MVWSKSLQLTCFYSHSHYVLKLEQIVFLLIILWFESIIWVRRLIKLEARVFNYCPMIINIWKCFFNLENMFHFLSRTKHAGKIYEKQRISFHDQSYPLFSYMVWFLSVCKGLPTYGDMVCKPTSPTERQGGLSSHQHHLLKAFLVPFLSLILPFWVYEGARTTERDAWKINFWVVHVVAQVVAHARSWSVPSYRVKTHAWRYIKARSWPAQGGSAWT